MRRGFKTVLLPFVLALLIAAALPVAAGESEIPADDITADSKADTVKLVVKVLYENKNGMKKPLKNAEVFALVGGVPMHVCTNDKGKAIFKNLTPGATVQILATGPAVSDAGCTNKKFKNPSTKKLMYVVFYDNHHGVQILDSFDLPMTGKRVVKFVARDAKNKGAICQGMKPTLKGTAGPDELVGTAGRDIITGRGGDDLIDGAAGSDVVCAGPGNDEVLGGEGDDWLHGEGGDDILDGEDGHDTLVGGAGTDTCISGETLTGCEA